MKTARRCGKKMIIKARAKTDEERKNAEQCHNPRYHEGRGKHLKRYRDGWMEEGSITKSY
jgi:hypothetical protein